MAGIKNQMLRLRSDTVDKLRFVLDVSSHRSMSALADELLEQGLDRRIAALSDSDVAAQTLRSLARRDG
jgi:hypothetical protein